MAYKKASAGGMRQKSMSSPRTKHPIDKRGRPVLKVTVPGYSMNEGTPDWIAKAARKAERHAR